MQALTHSVGIIPEPLALTTGTRLGSYEIVAPLGAGGMGEVYQATDTNLKRQVAIKVLPAALADDADRLARFRREAEVLAALNHPHIAAIYGLEKTADFTALVMELVEGDDLSQVHYVQAFLDHADLSTTSRYLNITSQGMHAALKRVEAVRAIPSQEDRPSTEEKTW